MDPQMETERLAECKEEGAANATLWREPDTAIARHRHVEFTWVKAHSGILLNECANQLPKRGVAGDSYSEEIPGIPVPADELESSQELEISEEEATRFKDWEDPDHLPPSAYVVGSVGLAAKEQMEEQENMLKRFKPSPVSGILKRAIEQPAQSEIILVPSDSGSISPKVSSKDSDSEMQLPDSDESSVVFTGNGAEVVYDGSTHVWDRREDTVTVRATQ
jgi:hypothetical protein